LANKDERERRRAARLAAEQAQTQGARRRLTAGYVVAGLLALALVAGLIVALAGGGDDGSGGSGSADAAHIQVGTGSTADLTPDDRAGAPAPPLGEARLDAAADAARCELRLDLPEEGDGHFTDEGEGEYDTTPPTSGDHYGVPTETASGALADGAYADAAPQARVVHSLEHGRVAVQYSPDLSEEDQLALKGVFDESPPGMLLFPNPDMPYAVAATAWRQLIGCETYEGATTLDAIRDFRDTYRGQGPEDVPLAPPG
jgi:Protein of unknown function (DUF3105)